MQSYHFTNFKIDQSQIYWVNTNSQTNRNHQFESQVLIFERFEAVGRRK